MNRSIPVGRQLAALGAVLALGCAGQTAPTTTPAPVAGATQPDSAGLERGIALARADSARYPYTEADIHFMTGMIGHHAQAVVMARMAESRGARPAILTLAGRIINAQHDEIALMQNWLRDRRQPVPEPGPDGVMAHHGGHSMLMPGMLTPEQIEQLSRARAAEFDESFLRFMIQHHNGAVKMVKTLFDTYGAAQDQLVFKFASDVNIDQTTEIARMEKMLVSIIVERTSK
ncbi:MAG: DUF305 domain-containing protein [Gemmatimonadales bacterium]